MTDEQYNGIIETIEKQNNICEEITYRLDGTDYSINNVFLDENGQETQNSGWAISKYLEAEGKYTTIIKISDGSLPSICFYNKNYDLISCENYDNRRVFTIINPTQTKYIKASIQKDSTSTIIQTTKCYNANEKLINKQDQIIQIGTFIIGLVLVAVLLLRRNSYR